MQQKQMVRNENPRHEYPEAMPYVVRDLSWELARYLEAQDSPQSASVSADSAGGRPGWTKDEERLAG